MTYELIQVLDATSMDSLVAANSSLNRWLEIYRYSVDTQPRSTVTRLQSGYQRPALSIAPAAQPIRLQISYADCLGRPLQTKQCTGEASMNKKWLHSGTVITSITGLLVLQSLPRYGASSGYEAVASGDQWLVHDYDVLSRLVQQTLPSGDRRQAVHGAWCQVRYDQNVMASRKNPGAGLPQCIVVLCKDSAGRAVGSVRIAAKVCQCTSTTYDVLGRPLAHQDARLTKPNVVLTYNLLGQVVSRKSVDRGEEYSLYHTREMLRRCRLGDWTTHHSHDSAQRPLLTRVLSPAQAPIIVEECVYGDSQPAADLVNAIGQLVFFKNEKGQLSALSFDLLGECLEYQRDIFLPDYSQDPSTTFNQSNAPRDRSLVPVGWASESFPFANEYNALGQLLAQRYPDGQVCLRDYNVLSQLTALRVGLPAALQTVVSNLTYQEAGLRTSTQLGTRLDRGITSVYGYDAETHRLVSVQSFDAKNRCLQDQSYSFDPVGNLTKLKSAARQIPSSDVLVGSTAAVEQSFVYDGLYRLLSAQGLQMPQKRIVSDVAVLPQQTFANAASFALELYTQSFEYDIGDNLTRILHTHPDGSSWSLGLSVAADSNRFASLTSTKDNRPVSIAQGKSLYDAAGNMQKLDEITDLAWDHTNQLSQATVDRSASSQGKVTEFYGYRGTAFQQVPFADAPGDRGDYHPSYFGGQRGAPAIDPKPLAEYGGRLYKITCFEKADKSLEVIEQVFLGSYERKRIFAIARTGQPRAVNTLVRHTLHVEDDALMASHHRFTLDTAARETPRAVVSGEAAVEQWQYHLTDHLHSSVLVLDDQGSVLSFEGYQPHGCLGFIVTRDAKQLSLQDYHYSGELRDEVTGLYHYGARYYAPQFGRWLSPDPAGLVDGLNLYAMVRNNPLSFWDWLGFVTYLYVPYAEDRKMLEVAHEWALARNSEADVKDADMWHVVTDEKITHKGKSLPGVKGLELTSESLSSIKPTQDDRLRVYVHGANSTPHQRVDHGLGAIDYTEIYPYYDPDISVFKNRYQPIIDTQIKDAHTQLKLAHAGKMRGNDNLFETASNAVEDVKKRSDLDLLHKKMTAQSSGRGKFGYYDRQNNVQIVSPEDVARKIYKAQGSTNRFFDVTLAACFAAEEITPAYPGDVVANPLSSGNIFHNKLSRHTDPAGNLRTTAYEGATLSYDSSRRGRPDEFDIQVRNLHNNPPRTIEPGDAHRRVYDIRAPSRSFFKFSWFSMC